MLCQHSQEKQNRNISNHLYSKSRSFRVWTLLESIFPSNSIKTFWITLNVYLRWGEYSKFKLYIRPNSITTLTPTLGRSATTTWPSRTTRMSSCCCLKCSIVFILQNKDNNFIKVLFKQKMTNHHLTGELTGFLAFFKHLIIYILRYIAQLYRVLHKSLKV